MKRKKFGGGPVDERQAISSELVAFATLLEEWSKDVEDLHHGRTGDEQINRTLFFTSVLGYDESSRQTDVLPTDFSMSNMAARLRDTARSLKKKFNSIPYKGIRFIRLKSIKEDLQPIAPDLQEKVLKEIVLTTEQIKLYAEHVAASIYNVETFTESLFDFCEREGWDQNVIK